jgi:hypothetical protein
MLRCGIQPPFGSKADNPERANFFRFTPESGHGSMITRRLLLTQSGQKKSRSAAGSCVLLLVAAQEIFEKARNLTGVAPGAA